VFVTGEAGKAFVLQLKKNSESARQRRSTELNPRQIQAADGRAPSPKEKGGEIPSKRLLSSSKLIVSKLIRGISE